MVFMATVKKIRLMQITHDLAIGGLQQVVVNLCRSLNRDVFDISVLCLRDLGCFVEDVRAMGIPVYNLPPHGCRTDYLSCAKVGKILREHKIEIIHTHNTQPFIDGTIGALMAGVKTIIHTDHARHFPDKRRYMIAERMASYFAYKVVGVSEHTTDNLIKYERIPAAKLTTIHNGIDGSRFNIRINKAVKKKALGISSRGGPIIGLGVRLSEQKGITYLLKALVEVKKTFPNISLVIAGDGPVEQDLKREALTLNLQKNVLFLGPRQDIPEILKLLDLYVLPSLWEGMPLVLLEAMAAGCPVLATDVGGVSSVIKHGTNGSIVKPRDPQMLAGEMVRLLSNDSIRRGYAGSGLKIFEQKFSAAAMAAKYEKIYLRASS